MPEQKVKLSSENAKKNRRHKGARISVCLRTEMKQTHIDIRTWLMLSTMCSMRFRLLTVLTDYIVGRLASVLQWFSDITLIYCSLCALTFFRSLLLLHLLFLKVLHGSACYYRFIHGIHFRHGNKMPTILRSDRLPIQLLSTRKKNTPISICHASYRLLSQYYFPLYFIFIHPFCGLYYVISLYSARFLYIFCNCLFYFFPMISIRFHLYFLTFFTTHFNINILRFIGEFFCYFLVAHSIIEFWWWKKIWWFETIFYRKQKWNEYLCKRELSIQVFNRSLFFSFFFEELMKLFKEI